MTNAYSKLSTFTCKEFQHAWTEKCVNASAGSILAAMPFSLRLYSVVYILSFFTHQRIPTKNDVIRTLKGIIQSSCFLTTNSFAFIMYNCLLRQMMGYYTMLSVAFIPSFLASLTAILLERPARRPLLALYVSNVATEAVWRMAESRGWVHSLPLGQTMIFGVSISIVLYLYRLGLHKSVCKDSIFKILHIFLGKSEEGPLTQKRDSNVRIKTPVESTTLLSPAPSSTLSINDVSSFVRIYSRFIGALKSHRHNSCPHSQSCVKYILWGGLKPFIGGLGLKVAFKLLLNPKNLIQKLVNWRRTFMKMDTLKWGIFLGSFSLLYKAVSCLLRHSFGYDDERFAIPAGLIGSIAFTQYADNTTALYVMWKILQLVYNLGIAKGKLPHIPGFTIALFCFSTATLFHAAILEPKNLRESYYEFLVDVSGGRLNRFRSEYLDVFGLNTGEATAEVLQKLKVEPKTMFPKFSLV